MNPQMHQLTYCLDLNDKLQLRRWHRHLVQIRGQATACGKYLANSQLVSFLMSTYFTSATIFVSLTLFKQNDPRLYGIAGNMSFFALYSLLTIVLKVPAAVKVTNEVN